MMSSVPHVKSRNGQEMGGARPDEGPPDRGPELAPLAESLQRLIAEARERHRQPLRHGFVHGRRDTHTVVPGQLLDALRQNHAGPGYRVVGDDHLAERDADSDFCLNTVRGRIVVRPVGILKRHRRVDRVGRAWKLGHQGVSSQLVCGASVALDALRQAPKCVSDTFVGDALVQLHERSRSDDVRVQDDGKTGLGRHGDAEIALCTQD